MKRLLLIALLISSRGADADTDTSKAEISVTQLSGTVFLLQGKLEGSTYGGNVVASVGPDGVLLVDSEYASLSAKIRDELRKLAGGEPKIRFIIDTHWHRDHSEGTKDLGKDATIIAHKAVRALLSTKQTMMGHPVEPYPATAWPTITFDDSLSIFFNGEEIRVVHLPNGHTGGDSVVLFTRSKVLHTGDIYTGPVFPFVDLEHGGNVEGLDKNVRTLLTMISSDTKVVPGHRALTDVQALKTYDRMLSDSLATVKRGIAEHRDLKAIQERGLASEWKTWEWELLKTPLWLDYVYRSVSKN